MWPSRRYWREGFFDQHKRCQAAPFLSVESRGIALTLRPDRALLSSTREGTVGTTLLRELQRIQRLSVNELRLEWSKLFDGEPCRSRNRSFLVKRLCWRTQELRHGGLSDRAKIRIAELATDTWARSRTPREALQDATAANVKSITEETLRPKRDPRLPSPGTVITRQYKGRELRLTVHEDHFELDGQSFGSLSEAARHVTGSRWNGRLFWGLTQRRRKSK